MPPGGDIMKHEFDNGYLQVYEANQRLDVVEWLNCLFPELNLPLEASEEELREILVDGTFLCHILNRVNAGSIEENHNEDECTAEQKRENLKRFLSALDEMGLPSFNATDLEQGSISTVIECLICLRDHCYLDNGEGGIHYPNSLSNGESLSRKRWNLPEVRRSNGIDVNQGDNIGNGENSVISTEERSNSSLQSKFQHLPHSPIKSEPSTTLSHQVGDKFHEVFLLKQGHYSDLSTAKISELMKSNSLDSASTQSLMNVVNGIIDESIEKKNGEIPHRVACLFRIIVQEIERRMSDQAEHIGYLNSLIKAREEKYQSRIRVLETISNGTSEETQIAKGQIQQIKSEKTKIEERKKSEEQDMAELIKEKENCNLTIQELKKEMEIKAESYEHKCHELETKSEEAKLELEKRIKEAEFCLAETRKRTEELEEFSESKVKKWNRKEHIYQNFIGLQSQSLGGLRLVSESIRKEMVKRQKIWEEEFTILGRRLKGLTDAADNYHTVLAENRRLYNEVQELKGNIRVYCRIRPFLPGQNGKTTTIDYIGENGELLIVNPSKQGKDGHRMFKFNKVFGPAASQEDVFLDTQPLIRSVLDGYNVCIFAYGQTGSGKTYTMSGPNASSAEAWGVNYRALNDLFHISRTRRNTFIYEVGVQMVEIYNEQVRDLLSNDSSQKRLGIWSSSQPNGLAVPDASLHPVKSTSDVLELMQIGQMNRAVGATALNERSSRSHSVLTVHVRGVDLESGATLRGCLHLVDLAGSERVDRSEVTGDRLKEAQHINKSLSALGDVVFALAQKSPHVPYRNSKLTQLLQSSLGGQAKALMFVQINPDVESYSETISTLKFAERVSGVELGAARSNKEGKDIRELMEQVAYLKDAVARRDEEIERLKLLKDLKTQSPISSKRIAVNSARQQSSSPGRNSLGVTPQVRKLLNGKSMGTITDNAASDPEVCSEYSDKNSEAGSLQSVDDFKQQKEIFCQTKPVGVDSGDIDLLGFGDGDSEERLSDISDSGLSMGTETDGSISSVVEYTLFPEVSKPAEDSKEKASKVPSRVPRPPLQKSGHLALVRSKLKDSPSGSRKSSNGQVSSSSSRPAKRWQ